MSKQACRFRGWYKKKKPIVGQVSIPFLFHLNKDTLKISIDHLVHDNFDAEALTRLEQIPEEATDLNFSERYYELLEPGRSKKVIQVSTSNPIRQHGIISWFDNLNWDKENNIISGYVNFGIAVQNAYNAKVSIE